MRIHPGKWLRAPIALWMQTRDSQRASEAFAARKSPKFEGN